MRKKRCDVLNELLAAMRVLRLRMLNSLEPLGILLRKSDSTVFRGLGNSLWEGRSLQECWFEMRDAGFGRGGLLVGLNNEDLHILDEFFLHLGKSGRDEQCELFASIIAAMEEAQQQAKRAYMDTSKLYTALGTLVGIGICVLMI